MKKSLLFLCLIAPSVKAAQKEKQEFAYNLLAAYTPAKKLAAPAKPNTQTTPPVDPDLVGLSETAKASVLKTKKDFAVIHKDAFNHPHGVAEYEIGYVQHGLGMLIAAVKTNQIEMIKNLDQVNRKMDSLVTAFDKRVSTLETQVNELRSKK